MKTKRNSLVALLFALTFLTGEAAANSFYASPTRSSSGSGTMASPWEAMALAQPAAVQPGDTIWLLGSTYAGSFTASWTWFWGFEVTNSNPSRALDTGEISGSALVVEATNSRFIKVAIYSADCDNQGRVQTVQVLNTQTGQVGDGRCFTNE
jgi:hypothetical protein